MEKSGARSPAAAGVVYGHGMKLKGGRVSNGFFFCFLILCSSPPKRVIPAWGTETFSCKTDFSHSPFSPSWHMLLGFAASL